MIMDLELFTGGMDSGKAGWTNWKYNKGYV